MPSGFVSHIDLNVADLVASSDFYGLVLEHLGFEPRAHEDDSRACWGLTYDDETLFEIEIRNPREPSEGRRHERYASGLDHLALQADSRAAVDELFARLVDSSYLVADPPREYDYAPGYYAVALDDPDGIRIEVVHDPTRDTVPLAVEISYLAMHAKPGVLRTSSRISVAVVATPMPELNKFFYSTVGADWMWHSRLPWTRGDWLENLQQPGHETWIASVDGVPAGYFELLHSTEQPEVEILYFGLLPAFTGAGLGSGLLAAALEQAWRDPGTARVALDTCTLDHPRALPNYLAAGFEIENTERVVAPIPRRMVP